VIRDSVLPELANPAANSLTSPIMILDANASGPYRFYRALLGP